MEILLFDILPSTQKYLIRELQEKTLNAPIAVMADEQSNGIGSRNNMWTADKGNFFASMAFNIDELPSDLPLGSASIYFAYMMKKVLFKIDNKVWLKWPNDLYLKNNKIGGIITQKVGTALVCGIGINLIKSQNSYSALSSQISTQNLFQDYLVEVERFPSWKQVFSEFEIEFELSRVFFVHIKNRKKSLKNAILCSDGSLIIDKRKVFSLR